MSADAEVLLLQALVGDALVSVPQVAARLDKSGLTPGDFQRTETQALFVALSESLRAGKRPEALEVMRHVGARVPRELVMRVLTDCPPGFSAQRIGVVREASQRRSTLAALRGLADMVAGGASLDAAMGEIHRVVQGLESPSIGRRTAEGDLLTLVDRMEANARGERPPILATGINALDLAIGGLQPTLTVIGAMPGVGKSALIAALLRNVAQSGTKVGLVSLEDSREWWVERVVAEASRLSITQLAHHRLNAAQLEDAADACGSVHGLASRVVIDDRHGLTTDEVVATARAMVAEGCKAVFVDHLGEIRLKRSDRHDLDIAEALQALRGIAKTYSVPVVVACHLRRRDGLEVTSEPRLTDFAFSSGVERMARVALGLYRGNESEGGQHVMCCVLKQTRGLAGFSLRLNLSPGAAMVAQTEAPESLRRALGY